MTKKENVNVSVVLNDKEIFGTEGIEWEVTDDTLSLSAESGDDVLVITITKVKNEDEKTDSV
jgi:hypothetical protein